MSEDTASDKNVEIWKVKKLIKSLQKARGNGTSMISLIIPPGDQVQHHYISGVPIMALVTHGQFLHDSDFLA